MLAEVLKRKKKNPKTIYILTTMGSRKNYKASVEVGSEVFRFCVIVSTSTLRVDRALVPSLVTVAPVWFSVRGVCFFYFLHSKRCSVKKPSQRQWTDGMYCFTQKQEAESLSMGPPPQSESENPHLPLGPLIDRRVSLSCSCV